MLARTYSTLAAPLTGIFAVSKPSGITSTTILDHLQHVCRLNKTHPLVQGVLSLDGSKRAKRGLVKIGHGGTLDPLARGIVVVGMGTGCKKLHKMSGSSKVYIAEGRLGFSTTTLDCTGFLVDTAPTDHITKDLLLSVLDVFKGEIEQTPPLYSALNMDGKRLYDYAREGIPLPREIPTRKVSIFALDLCSYANETPDPTLKQLGFKVDGHDNTSGSTYEFKSGFVPKSVGDPDLDPKHVPVPTQGGLLFHIRVHCSSGTYIRTLISDIATRLGTVGHMTDLLRVEQSGYKLGGEATLEMSDCEDLHKVNSAIQAGNRIWDKRYEKATFSASE
ncbi:hypothetical protein CPC16_010704 [Podila verticillata]|nr:hypothetical protein CPC16_010704 [Podila verticillata]